MGADNWAICPRCKKKAEADYADAVRAAGEAYGKVSAEEYVRMVAALPQEEPDLIPTLREDYELGTSEDGKFYVIYSGGCNVCGFSHKFRHDEQLNP